MSSSLGGAPVPVPPCIILGAVLSFSLYRGSVHGTLHPIQAGAQRFAQSGSCVAGAGQGAIDACKMGVTIATRYAASRPQARFLGLAGPAASLYSHSVGTACTPCKLAAPRHIPLCCQRAYQRVLLLFCKCP